MTFMKDFTVAHHGRTVHGKVCFPDTVGKHPLIIFSHGYNGSLMDFTAAAEFFARQGYAAICFNFCGGSTRDTSGFPTFHMTLFTEKEDLISIIEEVRSWYSIDPDQIFLFGASMGGMVSSLAAAQNPEWVRGLILLYPALCIADNWNSKYPDPALIPEKEEFWGMTLGKDFTLSLHDLHIYDVIPSYRGPVLIMHGMNDPIVPLSYSEKASLVYNNADLYVFQNEAHGFTESGNHRMEGMTLMFLEKCLQ